MNLTEHFTLEELIASQTAARHGFDNTPGAQEVASLTRLCEQILEPARLALGPLHISSGYRAPNVNAAVGGSKSSAHMKGFAADVIPLQVSKRDFALWVIRNCEFDQVIFEFGSFPDHPSWIHVSAEPRNRKEVLRTVKGGGYAPVNL
jgi:uncharacterized protein YcbK (DUF882 family)